MSTILGAGFTPERAWKCSLGVHAGSPVALNDPLENPVAPDAPAHQGKFISPLFGNGRGARHRAHQFRALSDLVCFPALLVAALGFTTMTLMLGTLLKASGT